MKSKVLILFLLVITFLGGCSKDEKGNYELKYSETLAKLISRSTSGSISRDETIKVWFNYDLVDEHEINKEIQTEIFTFSPSIEGKTFWASTKLLIFEPDEPLKFRQKYNGVLNINSLKIDSISTKIENLEFNFDILGREISNFSGSLSPKNKDNPDIVNYRGLLGFTEKTSLEDLNNSIILEDDNQEYNLEIFKEPGTNNFSFISADIKREKATKNFKFIINKEILDISEDFIEEFQITTLSELKILKTTKLEDDRTPKIRLEFSDEIDFEQKLNGMITVNDEPDIKIQRIGNSLIIDGEFQFGEEYTISVEKGVKSKWGTKLNNKFSTKVKFSDIKPQVSFASDGILLPTSNNYKLQFFTCNLKRVHIEIKKVYEKSLNEFLRSEKIKSSAQRKEAFNGQYINRVGVIVHNETYEIISKKNQKLLSEIDLTDLIKNNDQGLFLIRLNFNSKDMMIKWSDNKNRFIEEEGQIYKPLLFSNIGLTCKVSNKTYNVYATDLVTAKPLEGVQLSLNYTYYDNNNIIDQAITNDNGIAKLSNKKDRWYSNVYIEAKKDGQRSIIKFDEMNWNSSGFNIEGVNEESSGIKSFSYTERGVYRPGDEINLSIIARNLKEEFPENHPLTVSFYNPQRKKVSEITNKKNKDGFYSFRLKTELSDPTGNWTAQYNFGNQNFSHKIKIETIVPYKLKIEIEPKHKTLLWNHKELQFKILSKYLFGTPSSDLPLSVEVDIVNRIKRFDKFAKFTFSNPTLKFNRIKKQIYEGKLDNNGLKDVSWDLPSFKDLPSSLNIKVMATITEKGGRQNKNWLNIPYETYSHYVGIQHLKYRYVKTGTDLELPVILLDAKGNATSGKTIKYRIYKNSRNWWWTYSHDRKLKFKSDSRTVLVKEGEIISKTNASAIKFNPIDKGEYLIEVIDELGTKHSSGIFIYANSYGGSSGGDKNVGTLALNSDKQKYSLGEEAIISFPSPKEGSILFTVERWNKILDEKWFEANGKDEMVIKVPITKEMVPNAYITISIIQPHSQTINDRPIRTFGIIPIIAEDKETKHFVDIITPEEFRPEEDFTVNIQTSNRKQSQFTIAVVDEGLLDITQYKTPDPWKYFFRKIRLAVNTYDVFSHVISANIGNVLKTFSIGGGMDYRESQLQPEKGKKRFKPVSLFKGPITTDINGKASVKFTMPNYIGSVRIMVISASQNSYARAEKTVPVKKELMIMPTLPRVVGPNEKFRVPVTIFGLKENIGKVKVSIKTKEPIEIEGDKSVTLDFKNISDQDCYFNLFTKMKVGQSRIDLLAKSDKYTATYSVDLMVRPTSARFYSSSDLKIEKGNSEEILLPLEGIEGTNRASLTISSFPNINFGKRLEWLVRYPFGCIEQTTSAIFPQLYLKKFIKYPDAKSEQIDKNLNSGIKRLRKFQTFAGSFAYWPYGSKTSDWGTLYAGHFMIEAKKLGYYTPEDLYLNWLNYNKSEAQWHKGSLVSRVYRALILAIDGNAELSEMNTLKESNLSEMSDCQKWQLAASYKLAGLTSEAEILSSNLGSIVDDYYELSGSYGSALRDKAMILEAAVILERFDIADAITKELSLELSTQRWHSTQTIGYSLLAIGKYFNVIHGKKAKPIIKGYVEKPNGDRITLSSSDVVNINFTNGFGKFIKIYIDEETTTKNVYTTLAWDGVPIISNMKDENKNVNLKVYYLDEEGNNFDPSEIKQGTNFYARFNVEKPSQIKRLDELALMQIFPSGWEIVNTRLIGETLPTWTNTLNLNKEEYSDIRDDRVLYFFDLYNYSKQRDVDFIVKLSAVTVGEFELPGTLLEAMYNHNYRATKKNMRVKVIAP